MQIYRSFYILFIKFPFIFLADKITTFPPFLQIFYTKKLSIVLQSHPKQNREQLIISHLHCDKKPKSFPKKKKLSTAPKP